MWIAPLQRWPSWKGTGCYHANPRHAQRCVDRAMCMQYSGTSRIRNGSLLPGRPRRAWRRTPFRLREFKLPWRNAGPPNHHDDKWIRTSRLSIKNSLSPHLAGPDEHGAGHEGETTSPPSGTKSSFSIALMCTTGRWNPARTSTNQGPEKGDLRPGRPRRAWRGRRRGAHQPSERDQTIVFKTPESYHRAPDSGARQCKSRA